MKNKILKTMLGIVFIGVFVLTGCFNTFTPKLSDSQEYGTLIIGQTSARSLNVNSIKAAKVTITGNGISTTISKTTTDITNGVGTVTFTQIPVGKNRIITVQAYSDTAASQVINDAILKAVVDINAGVNTIQEINWLTSRKGYVYDALFKADVNISNLTSSEMGAINAAIPDCDATSINLSLFVSDFKSSNLRVPSTYIIGSDPSSALKRLTVSEATDSTESAPKFIATAYFSDGTDQDVSASATWESTNTTVATVSNGNVTLKTAGTSVIKATYTVESITKTGAEQTLTVIASGGTIDKIYFKPSSNWQEANARFAVWVWKTGADGEWKDLVKEGEYYVCDNPNGADNVIFVRMNPGTTENDWGDNIWNQTGDISIPAGKDTFVLNAGEWDNATGTWQGELTGSYSGGTLKASIEAGQTNDPMEPGVLLSPASASLNLTGALTISYVENNATVSQASVSISGAVSKSYTLSDFTNKTLNIPVSSLNLSADQTIHVSVSITNSEGTTTASASYTITDSVEDPFTWDNANVYFVLTDRFANGDPSNDHSYGRQNGLSGDENVATFHGGDIKGLTQNIDYFKKLGINAIWITAPYEQVHGWVSGKDKKFPHYAFHGYYTLDWTYMDRNMGTIDEFRTFVQTFHAEGIRVVLDVVINHVGYNNVADMVEYNHGYTPHQKDWLEKVDGKWDANDGVNWDHSVWESWWGPWIRSFAYEGGGEYGGSCGGLPDIRSELSSSVGIAPVLLTKWGQESGAAFDAYKLPAIANVDWYGKSGDWRTDKNVPPVDYQIVWLSAWVREFGIDGFRCDTAKHVEPQYWGRLKDACEAALVAWRNDPSKVDTSGAKNWTQGFWMTGECFGWTSIDATGGDYYGTGKFDSMINFTFNGGNNWDGNYRTNYPKPSNWGNYLSINSKADSDGNGNRDNVLTYISSHDTALTRVGDQKAVGTGLILLPGGIQIYYGDESYREKAYTGCGDGDMMTRGDMNLDAAKTSDLTKHWGKLGNFRKYNPAVGAGTGSAYKRSYSGPAGENKVAIGISGSNVDVQGLFSNGTKVYNWYDGTNATVSNGSVSFSGGSETQPILVSEKNPADYGLSF